MNLGSPFDALLQVLAALLIFIISYLGLVICTIICLVIGEIASERDGVVRAYGANSNLGKNAMSPTRARRPYPHEIAERLF